MKNLARGNAGRGRATQALATPRKAGRDHGPGLRSRQLAGHIF